SPRGCRSPTNPRAGWEAPGRPLRSRGWARGYPRRASRGAAPTFHLPPPRPKARSKPRGLRTPKRQALRSLAGCGSSATPFSFSVLLSLDQRDAKDVKARLVGKGDAHQGLVGVELKHRQQPDPAGRARIPRRVVTVAWAQDHFFRCHGVAAPVARVNLADGRRAVAIVKGDRRALGGAVVVCRKDPSALVVAF